MKILVLGLNKLYFFVIPRWVRVVHILNRLDPKYDELKFDYMLNTYLNLISYLKFLFTLIKFNLFPEEPNFNIN